jgi:hypothetical protein
MSFARMLELPGMRAVCLFVSPTNTVAIRVYNRVGFCGLESGVPGEGAEEWAELGWKGVELADF